MRNAIIRILQALVIVAVASSFAHADNFIYFKKKAAAGGGYTEELFYNVDHTSGDNVAYTVNRTASVAGTFVGPPIVYVGATTPGTASSDGGDVLGIVNSASHRIEFPITGGDIFQTTQGMISFETYRTGTMQLNDLFGVTGGGGDANNEFKIYLVDVSGAVGFRYQGNSGNTVVTLSADNVTVNTWHTITVRWDTVANVTGIKIDDGSWSAGSGADIVPWATEPAVAVIGYSYNANGSTPRPVYFDTLKMWTTYDGS